MAGRARGAGILALLAGLLPSLHAQDLTPRAYVVTPRRSNAVILTNVFNDGELLFDGSVPITGATGRLDVPALSLYRAVSVFGRSGNVTATLPYGVGTFKGTVAEAEVSAYRSGLLDAVFRVSVNLLGAPPMDPGEMMPWRTIAVKPVCRASGGMNVMCFTAIVNAQDITTLRMWCG